MSLLTSTHVTVHNCLWLQLYKLRYPVLTSRGTAFKCANPHCTCHFYVLRCRHKMRAVSKLCKFMACPPALFSNISSCAVLIRTGNILYLTHSVEYFSDLLLCLPLNWISFSYIYMNCYIKSDLHLSAVCLSPVSASQLTHCDCDTLIPQASMTRTHKC